MKKILLVLLALLLSGCSSVRMVDSWKNEGVLFFKPRKLLILGVTQNLTARKIFEENLRSEFMKRNINAYESTGVFDIGFTDSEKTEEEVESMVNKLSEKGFDAVIVTVVKGVDKQRRYGDGYYTVGYSWHRFGRYYYTFQDIYYNPGYYNEYKVYHLETSIYNINEGEDKSLVWVGALDIVDPQTITTTVNDYISAIVTRLEQDQIITRL